jgi:hypothetical protein
VKRYAVKFRVNEYWKGSPANTLILYETSASPYDLCPLSLTREMGGVYRRNVVLAG